MKLEQPLVGTPSRVETGSRCHRRHFLANRLERGLYTSPSAAFGTVIHAGAAVFWTGGAGSVAAEEAQKAARIQFGYEFNDPSISQESHSVELAESMMSTYGRKATLAGPLSHLDGWQLVSTEERLEIPLRGFRLSFQTDRVVWNKQHGRLVVVDTKTAARLDARWKRQWELSLQMRLYRLATEIAFDRRVEVIVEGVSKDLPCKVEYVQCPEWSDAQLQEAADQFERVCTADKSVIDQATIGGAVDFDRLDELAVMRTAVNYQDCYSYGVECPFLRICRADLPERVGLLRAEYSKIESEF